MAPEKARWQGSCLWARHNAKRSAQDVEGVTRLGVILKTAVSANQGPHFRWAAAVSDSTLRMASPT